jgi:glycosyltransferase involved in cell wall biosynthesis
VSRFVADSLVSDYRIPRSRIDVIAHGVADAFRPMPKDRELLARFGLTRYLLCVGNLLPVKNQVTAVRAFARLARRFPGYQLALAGSPQHRYANDVIDTARRLGVEDRVKLLGFVNEPTLVALLNGATAILIPSLTEGFCVTLLEAMACGLPAVASGLGALRELGTGAAEFVDDPWNDREFALKAETYLADPQARQEAAALSLARVSGYRWAYSARHHLETYERCLREFRTAGQAAGVKAPVS